MNKPTPETDHLERNLGNAAHPVLSSFCRKLERERDEARAEMIRWMSIAEGRGRTEDDDTGKAMAKLIRQRDEAREQRDRLAEALQNVINEDGTPISIDQADVALQSLTTKAQP